MRVGALCTWAAEEALQSSLGPWAALWVRCLPFLPRPFWWVLNTGQEGALGGGCAPGNQVLSTLLSTSGPSGLSLWKSVVQD